MESPETQNPGSGSVQDGPQQPAAPQHPQAPIQQPPLPAPAPRNPAVAAYVRAVFSSGGMATVAWIAGVVLAAGLLGAILLLSAAASGADSSSPGFGDPSALGADFGQVIAGLLVALGVGFGGGISVDANIAAGFIEASGRASLAVFPLGVLAAVVAGSAVVARLRMRGERLLAPTIGAEIARAAIEGGLVALAMTVLTAFASLGGSGEFGGVAVRTRAGFVFVTVLVAVAVAVFLARTALRRRVSGAVDGMWISSLREAGLALAVQFAAFGAAAVVVLVIACADAESAAPLLAGLPLLGNLAVAGAALGQFGGLSAAGGSFGSAGITAFDVPNGHGWWAIVVAVLGLVVASVAVGLRRSRTARPVWGRTWQMPLIVFAVWCALALGAAGMTAQGEMLAALNFSGGGSVGLTWPTPFLAGIGAGLVSIGAEFLPVLVYRMHPSLLSAFGGRSAVQAWIAGTAAPATAQVPWPASQGAASTEAALPDPAPLATTPLGAPSAAPTAAPLPGAEAIRDPAISDPAPQNPGLPAPAPMSRRAKTRLIVALSAVGSVALLAVCAAVTVSLLNQSRDPAGAVREYLALLERGEAERASALLDPGIQNADRELLTDEVLGSAKHRISVESVETTSRSDAGARVHAVYSLDGERFEIDLEVARGPKEFLVLDTWRLEEPLLVAATLSGDGVPSLLVGETEIGFGERDAGSYASRDVYVYPGVYAVTGATNDYTTASVEELRAAASTVSGPAFAEVSVEPNEQFEEAVLKQVRARIAQCVEIPTNMDSVCPYITRDKELAEMKVVSQTDGFESIDLMRFEASPAKIAVRPNPTSWDKDPELRESDVTVSGGIEFVDGEPMVTEMWMGGW